MTVNFVSKNTRANAKMYLQELDKISARPSLNRVSRPYVLSYSLKNSSNLPLSPIISLTLSQR